eukprot:gnl/Hemi2/24577_TR8268_c0_g1_i1.p1 gnl/Hemi2/24577_TR8268_c0_g1~~gnl/Hemi2/24577_TR8268_c0_g1_i1.p1  ORF type:complete len:164 (+),score=59.02 gnl/Hemi2/24577_TR8268_c0_g1_i1:117-608(+)
MASSSSSTSRTVKLVSKTNEAFEVAESVAIQSVTVKNFLEGATEEEEAVIPLPNVESEILTKVIEYLRWHHDHKDAPDKDKEAFDRDFIKVEMGPLFDLILASNYMDIKPLLDLTTKTVQGMLRDKTAEEIRHTFMIPNDFTPEEEEEVRREYAWADGGSGAQ